jgi:hypothetical protein
MHIGRQFHLQLAQVLVAKTEVLTQLDRAMRAIEREHSFTTAADDVNMGGPVVVRINHRAQTKNPMPSLCERLGSFRKI